MPIPIGVLAAAGAPSVSMGDMVLIGAFAGDDASAAIDITNIPQTYKHLWLTGHMGLAGTPAANYAVFSMRLNSGTGISIWYEGVREATGAQAGAGGTITNGILDAYSRSWSYVSGRHFVIDNLFMDYANTSRARKGLIFNNSSADGITSSSNQAIMAAETNATAINSLRISSASGTVSSYSKLYLYGIVG